MYSKKEEKARILCISPFFAPLANSEAYCGSKLIRELVHYGYDVIVFSIEYEGTDPKGRRDDSKLWDELKDITIRIPAHSNLNKIYSLLWVLHYQTPSWARWIGSVIQAANVLHREKPFDLIYSRSLPTFAHIPAYWLANLWRRPWIANFNDPWEGYLPNLKGAEKLKNPSLSLMGKIWLKRIFNRASYITFPSERLGDFYVGKGKTNAKLKIIPHVGYESPKAYSKDNSNFSIVHAGKLGGLELTRSKAPDGFLKALREFLSKNPEARSVTRLVLVGPVDEQTERLGRMFDLDDVMTSPGLVSYEKSLDYIGSAAVCLLIEGKFDEGIYFPSKLADYIAAKKPVLALSPKIGVVADLARDKGVVRVDVDNIKEIEAAITDYYYAFQDRTMEERYPSDALAGTFKGRLIAESFSNLVQQALEKK